MKMSDDIEKMKIIIAKGRISLHDENMELITDKSFNSVKNRKDIIEFWKRSYRLEEKTYYIVIKHK